MSSRLSVHWQRTHPDNGRDGAIFARWRPRSVKIITSDETLHGIEVVPQESLVVARHHPLSENWEQRGIRDAAHAAEMGRGHADVCRRIADWIRAADPARDLRRVVFTGLNEPHVWSNEPPDLTARYYAVFARRLHEHGLCAGLLSLSVGWPANTGPDTPPVWGPFQAALDAYAPGDYLFLHEYWDERGAGHNWGWWAGRYRQCPWPIPLIIGECGLDKYVSDPDVPADRRGWRGWLSPQDYMNQLAWYDARLREDSRVHSAQIFNFDFSHPWSSFNIREDDMLNVFLPYVESQHNTPDPAPPPPVTAYPAWLHDIVDTLPKHPTLRYQQRNTPIRFIAIHHTAGAVSGEWSTPERIAQMHIEEKGWPGIAYHLFIRRDGTTYLTNRLETHSYHVANNNHHAVGVCFVGDMTKVAPTKAQLASGQRALAWLYEQLGLTPAAVMGHGDFAGSETACPGSDWWREMLAEDTPPTEPSQPPSVASIRWNAEQAVREIEAAQAQLAAARQRLLTNVIAPLYALEAQPPPTTTFLPNINTG